tara:strand:+ start:23639 stop:26374 length:2736 start_codon:yes stop_codon:yes gene_type:complete
MANSFVRYTGNNSTTVYAIPFSYRSQSDITVTLGGVATTAFSYNGAGTQITFDTAPGTDVAIQITRTTSQASQLVNYSSGSVLTETDLDTDSQQAFFMSQEAIDDANDVITLDAADFQWTASSKRIKSVANPTAAQDAVTKNYLESTWLSTSDKANITTLAGISSNITTVAGISSNVTSVAGNASNINTVAGVSANVTTVAGISSNVTTVAGIASNVTAVAADATDIGAVAGKATEIGRLGTADAVADMALLATTDCIADMALLATTDCIADMALLATTDVIADMNTLATSDIVSDLNTLATSDIVTDINLLATSDIVTDLNTLATSDIVSDLNTLATSDIVTDINLLATSDVVADLALLATSDIVSDINTLATSDIVTDLALLATSDFVADLNTLATSAIVSDMDTLADIAANVTTVAGVSANVTTVAGVSANVTTVAGIAANVTTVAGVSANVTTVATNIAGVNSFAERYRVASSDPGSSLDEGDLAYNTTDNALKYYNGSAWASITAGLGNIVEDTTPQLGGDLDLNSNSIDFPSTANISDVKDEDDMASNSATMLATQQSIKAYVDTTTAAVDVPTTRNLIINGAMEVAQRGTSHTTSAQTYLLDRFYTFTHASSGRTISQSSNAPDGFRKSIKLQRDSGSSDVNVEYLSQPAESASCVGFAGSKATISFYARAGANFSPTSGNITIGLYTGTGTDQSLMGGLTGSALAINATQALTTDWVRYEFTSGSVIATSTNQLVVQFTNTPVGTAGANDWWEITGVQVEKGESATDFVHEPFADTLFKCKRFYQKSFDYETAPSHTGYVAGHSEAGGGTGSVITATEYVTVTRYERALRVDPTIVYYRAQAGGLSDGEWAYYDGADNLDTSGLPSAATTQIVLRTAVPFASGGKTTGRAGITQGNYTADSEL